MHSLKTRITLATLAIFLIGVWSLSYYASRMLRQDMERLLGDQQFSTVSLVAQEVNQELKQRLTSLEQVAISSMQAMQEGPPAMQALIEQRPVLQTLFNGGIIAYGVDGTAIADFPVSAGRLGVNYMDVEVVAAALKEGRSTIDRPVLGKKLKSPVIGMVVPMRNAQGNVIGALAGVTNLGLPNFLDLVTQSSYGRTGGYVLIAPRYRLVVTASDKSRIMQTLPAPGANPMVDRFIQGFEGSAVLVNPSGAEVLASGKGVPVTGWLMIAALPTEEAFAPIRGMQQRIIIATLFLTLLAGGLTWWMLRRQFLPMLAAVQQLAAMSDTSQPLQPLAVTRQDEVGQLIGGFNLLLENLGQREEALKESEYRWKFAIEGSGDGLWDWNTEDNTVFFNKRWKEMLGFEEDEIGTGLDEWEKRIHPDDKAATLAKEQAYLDGRTDVYVTEHRLRCKDGSWKWILARGMVVSRSADGKPSRVIGTHTDITERKQAENAIKASEQRFRDIVNTTDGIVWEADARTFQFTFISQKAERLLGFPVENWLKPGFWIENLHPDDKDWAPEYCASCTGRLVPHDFEYRFIARDGRTVWLRDIVTVVAEDAMPRWLRGIMVDITDRKLAEQQLRVAATAFEVQEGVMVTDANNVILRVNRAFTDITGYAAEEIIGQTPRKFSSGRQDENFYAAMWHSVNSTGSWEGEIWNRRKNGEIYPEYLTLTAVKDSSGVVTNYVATFSDITVSKAAADEIRNLAFYDPLTQLPNRRLLIDRLQLALASSARSGKLGAVLFLDLDHFKTLNDTSGHDAGDLLLQQVAQRLISCVRECDTVARLGGDEFVVMLEDLSVDGDEAAEQTEAIGQKILVTLNQPYQLGPLKYHNTSSIGATLFNNHQSRLDELLKQADLALYQAKNEGRNTLRFFDPRMQETINARAALEHDLRTALEEPQFHLYFQVQVDNSNQPVGAEALLRWAHPERGLVLPAQFIPLAEETGLILAIGQWALQAACAQLAAWQQDASTRDLVLSINVSAKQFRQVGFVAQVQAAVQRHAINPMLLKLELTESMLLEDIEGTIAAMGALKEIGVQLSLDDFGTGYSSLQYLKRLPIDELKIDQSFVRDLALDTSDRAIVRTIIAMAQSLDLNVLAEGVETQLQRQTLQDNGCLHYQGYLFGKPLPIEQFDALLEPAQSVLGNSMASP